MPKSLITNHKLEFKIMKPDLSKNDFRYERKFLVPILNKSEIERVVKNNSYLFREIFYERQINNIYFDSLDMPSYFDNILGNSNRTKIRIRWYGEFQKVNNPTLELKIKKGEVGTKLSFPLKNFTFPLNLEEMEKVFETSNLPEWLIEKLKSQRFALINYYNRKYFLSACKNFRATIDSNLTYGEILNQYNLNLSQTRKEDFSILELKYNTNKNAKDIATQFPFRLTKSSKFVSGVTYFRGE